MIDDIALEPWRAVKTPLWRRNLPLTVFLIMLI